MKVKILDPVNGVQIYDANAAPIMLILDHVDRCNLQNVVDSDSEKFCAYPETWPEDQIHQFMEVDEDRPKQD